MTTVNGYVEDFMEGYVRMRNRPSEIAKKEGILRKHILPFFGAMEVDKIRPRQIKEYHRLKTAEGLSAKSINNQILVLSKLLHYVHEELEELDTLPSIRHLPVEETETKYFTDAEIEALAAHADDPWRAMIIVAAMTGMRISELRALRWGDVDLKGGRILVSRSDWMGHETKPKGKKALPVSLNVCAVQALKELRPSGSHLVFGRPPHGGMYTYRQCNWALEQIRKRAGVKEGQWHRLRHSFGTYLAKANLEAFAIKAAMRHSSLAVTDRYVHLSDRQEVEAVDALMAVFKFRRGLVSP